LSKSSPDAIRISFTIIPKKREKRFTSRDIEPVEAEANPFLIKNSPV
jgi:hypothetical protein